MTYNRPNDLNCLTLPPDTALLQNTTAMRYLRSIWIFMPGAAELEPIITAFPVGESEAQLKAHLASGPYRRTAAHMVTLLADSWERIEANNVADSPYRHVLMCQDALAGLQSNLYQRAGYGCLSAILDHAETWFGAEVATSVRAILLDVQKELQEK